MVLNNNIIVLDANNWKSKDDFYSSYCSATNAPTWFGNNLDALYDSFTGGICKITPEKIIINNLKNNFNTDFIQKLKEVCDDGNVELNITN